VGKTSSFQVGECVQVEWHQTAEEEEEAEDRIRWPGTAADQAAWALLVLVFLVEGSFLHNSLVDLHIQVAVACTSDSWLRMVLALRLSCSDTVALNGLS